MIKLYFKTFLLVVQAAEHIMLWTNRSILTLGLNI